MKFLDVSQHNRSVDFHAAKRLGFEACYVRFSSGKDADTAASEHVVRASEAGLLVGGYLHYVHWRTPREHYDAFDRVAVLCELIPMIDVETWVQRSNGVVHRAASAWVPGILALAELLRARWAGVGLYCNPSDWRAMGAPSVLRSLPLWLADYTGGPDLDWYAAWQTAPVVLDGVSPTPIDTNIARVSLVRPVAP